MRVGVLVVELYLPGNRSLKEKRRVVKALKERIKNRYNVSVAEVEGHDLYQRASLAVAMVGTDPRGLNGELDRIADRIHGMGLGELVRHRIEIW